MKKVLFFLLVLITSLFSKPILKFYCGSTMSEVMGELVHKFEKENNVKIVIITGGSGKLYNQITEKKDADLYLPGSQNYIKNDKNKLFLYKRLIGYNKAVILVAKSNPKGIRDLNDFTRDDVRVVLGNENSGSVGKIAKKILIRFRGEKYYKEVYEKAIKVDNSLEIVNLIKTKKADISIDWKAVVFSKDNKNYIDYLDIAYIAPKQKLFLALVKYSQYPDIAKKFIDFVFKNKLYLKNKGF